MKSLFIASMFLSLVSFGSAHAKVYQNIKVGSYQSVVDLNEYTGRPFFEVMKEVIYPAIKEEAGNRTGGEHLVGIQNGEGVELVLTNDVTTYLVKYKAEGEDKVERSGRSFGAIGSGKTKRYIADASYKHYLDSLEDLLAGNDREVRAFFSAILKVIADSDTSGVARLGTASKQVAADFVAIYVAEQYRRMTATDGQSLGSSHQWDDALVQVTLLSAFHSGQDEMKLMYEGEFTGKVYDQNACLYKAGGEDERRETTSKRDARLNDYWQFTVRSECPGRSGVNLTRGDFEKLGKALTASVNASIKELDLGKAYNGNFFKAASAELLNGSFEYKAADYTDMLVDILMEIRAEANTISEELSE